MQEVDLYSLLDCAINASIKAGDEIMKIYDSNFDFTTKKDDSPDCINCGACEPGKYL